MSRWRSPAATACRRLRLALRGERPMFIYQPERIAELLYRVEAARGYESSGELWCPGGYQIELGHEPATLVASTEPWETVNAMTPAQAHEYENVRRARLADLAHPAAGRQGRGRAGAGRRQVPDPAGRPHRRRHPGPGPGRGAAHGHRRVPLVHRLGAGHDDQPGGADPGHRTAGRGPLDPARLRALRARRSDPQSLPRGFAGRRVPHRRRVAVVLPGGRTLPGVHRRPAHAEDPAAGAGAHRRITTGAAPGSGSGRTATAC